MQRVWRNLLSLASLFCSEDRSSRCMWNIGTYLPSYMASYCRLSYSYRFESLKSEMKKANYEIPHYVIFSSFLLLSVSLMQIISSALNLFFLILYCRIIAVRCEPQTGVQVAIAQSPRKDFFPGQLVKERKWENLGGSFKEVRWDKMEGKNFLNKMELLMSSLTSSQWAAYKMQLDMIPDQEQMLHREVGL